MAFELEATLFQAWLRMAVIGPAGSGKTYSALAIATGLGERIALIDTEHGSASKYSRDFKFYPEILTSFSPTSYIRLIEAAASANIDVLIIDSLSHAWIGKEGALELADKAAARSKSGNRFTAWREVTPLHNALVEAILQAPLHIIATMRSKTEYVIEEDERGRKIPRKIGMQPQQREGLDYEFDVVGDLDYNHTFIIGKTRCRALDEAVIAKPGKELGILLKGWLSEGEIPQPLPKAPEKPLSGRTISEIIEKLPNGFKHLDPEQAIEAVEYAKLKCCLHLGVGSVEEIPEDKRDELQKFIKGKLPFMLRAKGYLPGGKSNAADAA